jgi:hypothetical protein
LVVTGLLDEARLDVTDEKALSCALLFWAAGTALRITLTHDDATWRWSTDRNGMMRAVVTMAGGMR